MQDAVRQVRLDRSHCQANLDQIWQECFIIMTVINPKLKAPSLCCCFKIKLEVFRVFK